MYKLAKRGRVGKIEKESSAVEENVNLGKFI